MKSLATFISYLFHPLFLPLYLTGLFFRYAPNAYTERFQLFFMLIIAIGAVIIPLAILGVMRITGTVNSLHMPNAKERRWPFVLFAISLYATKLLIDQINIQTPIQSALLAASLALIVCSLVLERIKISIHSMGAGGFTAFLIWQYMQFHIASIIVICAGIIISGLIGWSRLELKAHKEREVYVGWGFGFILFFLSFVAY